MDSIRKLVLFGGGGRLVRGNGNFDEFFNVFTIDENFNFFFLVFYKVVTPLLENLSFLSF